MPPAGFPHSDTLESQLGCQLLEAYRRLPRPSSAPGAKAFTVCPYKLTHKHKTTETKDARVHYTVLKQPPDPTPQPPHTQEPSTTQGPSSSLMQGQPETTTPPGACGLRTQQRATNPTTGRPHTFHTPKNPRPYSRRTHHPVRPSCRCSTREQPHRHPRPARASLTPHPHTSTARTMECWSLLRKEVIQPHLPVRLPCYDFVPIASPTFDSSPPTSGLGHRLRVLPTFVT